MKPFVCLLLASIAILKLSDVLAQEKPQEIPLYSTAVPNEKAVKGNEKPEDRVPTLSIFLPEKGHGNGTAVIVFPGGGYTHRAMNHEGFDVARKLNEQGIAAFVVKYRLPNPAFNPKPEIAPLQDAQQSIRLVRTKAQEWNIDPTKVGIMGFSAGGHLASTAGTHFTQTTIDNPLKVNLRPDFMLLIYPVINGDPQVAHKGSFEHLLGKNATSEKVQEFSNDRQVTAQTPPTFLVHASDDEVVKPENSILFYQALLKFKIPAELHIYQQGGHGFGLNNKTTQDSWFDRCVNWMKSNKIIPAS
ncbi:alpha/beta hydrolase [Pontibacter sp. SGAir0037]|uniref:alpha/beta hydrolase n=1 Tax=Pontibacter sp. SGAir0037 TaxID=2571030 RepID=UPI0010CD2B98|nr:alpha/beta hydrolase [Pontibacter sp. SGAir0037]QCR21860.1 hypothetical protein C1N53_05590 [Pontibacter sp. SGAir0037]